MKNNNQFLVFTSSFTILLGLSFALALRSYQPLFLFTSVAIITALINKVLPGVLNAISKKNEWDSSTAFGFTILISLFAFLVVGIVSFVEKAAWEFGSKPFFVSKAYTDNYSANEHRLFKMMCKARDINGPIVIKEKEGIVYARCGDFYPNVYMISADSVKFNKTLGETARDTGNEPVIIDTPSLKESEEK